MGGNCQMNWRDGLEGTALEIAECKEKNIRINAGPGTGKTYCLIGRIAKFDVNRVFFF